MHPVDKRIEEINEEWRILKNKTDTLQKEYGKYFYTISLCNSSDHYKNFIKDNPDWNFKSNANIMRPEQSGWMSDVVFKVLRHKISKKDFIIEAKKIVSPLVGNTDFDYFEIKLKSEEDGI